MAMLSLLLALLSCAPALASEDASYLDQALAEEKPAEDPARRLITPEEIFRRTRIALESQGVPAETDYQPELNGFAFTSTAAQIQAMLKYFDPAQQQKRFFEINGAGLQSFEDRDAKREAEYRFAAASRAAPRRRLRMKGLRVALDPGHMGGELWDERTGKYVKSSRTKVSEGMINLQTALLVEQKLRALGAEVMITHREPGPVSTVPYDKLSLKDFGRIELRARSLDDWFQSLVANNPESKIPSAFKNSSAVKKIFSERARGDYFIKREDLEARADKIEAFEPDLTLVIHFDSDSLKPSSSMPNITRGYVPGSFGKAELATGESRARFMGHIGRGRQWNDSVRLTQLVIDQISSDLNVPKPKTDTSGSTPVMPGVFARNLALTRIITGSPISYLECLSYGNAAEFARLSRTDGGTLQIGGKSVAYSKRLDDLAKAITKGVEKFVASTN